MTDELTVAVEGIELRGRIGVTDEERAVGQTLVVDVRLTPRARTRRTPTTTSTDTVDYGRVVDLVARGRRGRRVQAHRAPRRPSIADRLWDAFALAGLRSRWQAAPPVARAGRRGARRGDAPRLRRVAGGAPTVA